MTKDQVIERLKKSNRAQVHRDTGLPYRYLRHLVGGNIANPGSRQLDTLRAYFSRKDRPQQGRAVA